MTIDPRTTRRKPETYLPRVADVEVAQRNFDEGLKRFQAQGGPSRLCEAVRAGERSLVERKRED